jgi:hypothetical protein
MRADNDRQPTNFFSTAMQFHRSKLELDIGMQTIPFLSIYRQMMNDNVKR